MILPRMNPGTKQEFLLGPFMEGLDEKTDHGRVARNSLLAAVNVLLDEQPGTVTKKLGSRQAALMPSGKPAKYEYKFKKNDGTEYNLLSDGESLYSTTDMVAFTLLASGLDDTAYMQFETAFDRCWITNGSDYVMWYDGTNIVALDREYGAAVAATTEAGTDQQHIVDADLNQADDYWNLRRVVITSGTYAGMEGLVTDFDSATHKLTVSGFTANPGTGVGYKVGLVMPKGRTLRFNGNNLFMCGTTENKSEVRFSRADNPDSGLRMNVDNPAAWPANYSFTISQDDGDQIWTCSPVHRERFLITKGRSIYRVEPDGALIYRPVLVSQVVGCHYQDSWAVKDDVLHFVGSEFSGDIDLYVTDMVGIKPKHSDGRLMPTFRDVYRVEKAYKYASRASTEQFDTGEKSTLCQTNNGRLECRKINTAAAWNEVISAAQYAVVGANGNGVTVQGCPPWPVKYDANEMPTAATPAWTQETAGSITTLNVTDAPGQLHIYDDGGIVYYYRTGVTDSSKNTMVACRLKKSSGGWATVAVKSGDKIMYVDFSGTSGPGYVVVNGTNVAAIDITNFKVLNVLIDKDGNGSVYVDGARVWTGAAAASSGYASAMRGDVLFRSYSISSHFYWDYVYYDNDFKSTAEELPAALPETATVTVKVDYKRTPELLGRLRVDPGAEFSGACDAGSGQTLIVDSDLAQINDFWNGWEVLITSGLRRGQTATVTDYDSALKRLTITGLDGALAVGDTYQINRRGTIAIKTQSSDDDAAYSALAELTNGGEPGVDNATPVKRYLKVQLTLTRYDYASGPEAAALIGGFLWRMKPVQVGSNITAWLKWLDESTLPSGTQLVKKVRLAKTIAAPGEADFGAWQTVADGDDLGTVLTDAPPPAAGEGRWIDAIVYGSTDSTGITPYVDNFQINWLEGSNADVVISTFIYRKRIYITAISRTAAHNDLVLVLDSNNAWTKFTGLDLFRIFEFRGLIYGTSAADDKIYQMEIEGRYDDSGAPVESILDIGAIDGQAQRLEIKHVRVGHVGAASDVKVYLSYDYQNWTLMGTLSFTGPGVKTLKIKRGRIGQRHYLRLLNDSAQPLGVNTVLVGVAARTEP